MPIVTPSVTGAPVQPTNGAVSSALSEALTAPATTEAQTKEPKEMLSPKYAALARQQSAIRKQQEALKAREKEIEDLKASYEKDYIPKDRLKAGPLKALLDMGFTYDQLTQEALEDQQSGGTQSREFQKLKQELESVKGSLTEREKREKENQEQEMVRAMKGLENEARIIAKSNETEYELLHQSNAYDQVAELIKLTFVEENGKDLSVEEACKLVEAHLFEEAMKLASSNKIRSKLMPEAQVEKPAQHEKQITPIKTLTNAQTVVQSRPPSKRDVRERAIAAFLGQKT